MTGLYNTAFIDAGSLGLAVIATLAALAHDFRCSDPDNMALDPLKKRMQFLKSTKEDKAQMSSVVQQYAEQYAEQYLNMKKRLG